MGRGSNLFHYMLKEGLASDRPYDDFARSLIAGSAKSNFVVASVNPIVREHVEGKPGQEEGPDDLKKIHQVDTHDELTILYGRVFLGINLSCISCHDGATHLEKVNVYWSKLMGVGIVEPVDEFDLARQDPENVPAGWPLQPSNPELLDALAAWFRSHNHSLHSLFRLICNSSAYQLSAQFPGEWKDA